MISALYDGNRTIMWYGMVLFIDRRLGIEGPWE